MVAAPPSHAHAVIVSMKSGLEGRNNHRFHRHDVGRSRVSMKSGLEGRNNLPVDGPGRLPLHPVSMKSGLEGRNNLPTSIGWRLLKSVSMKSGLEGRNNYRRGAC